MSALNFPETQALYTAIGVMQATPGVSAADLVKLLHRLQALSECTACGSFFDAPKGHPDVATCRACSEIEEREAQERNELEAERAEDADRVSGGGYPR